MCRIFLLFCFSSLSTSILATTLIGIRVKDGFVIAADSKVTYKGVGAKGPTTACKIFRSGRFYFAIAGMASDRNRDFFPEKIVAQSFTDSDSFESSIERMELAVSDSLKIEMKRLKIEDHERFDGAQTDGGDVLTILAAAMVGDTPYMGGRGFSYLDGTIPTIEIRRVSCPGDCPGDEYVFFAGEQDAARKTINELFKNGVRMNVEFARKLVESEIQASPDDVGPPINILRVDKNGPATDPINSNCPILVGGAR